MNIHKYPPTTTWRDLSQRPVFEQAALDKVVKAVLLNIQKNGDAALREYTEKFDGVSLSRMQVTDAEIHEAGQQLSAGLKSAIQTAQQNIETFHTAQREEEQKIETMAGVECWRKSVAIDKVGLYIPGGTAPLFSTILMLGIPARIAGCREVVLCTPPDKTGAIHPAILYTAQLVGIPKIYKAGGAQAIAAMAYGTETIPQVYKIFGPGNQYVTKAKELVQQAGIAIDMPAGPSEVLVIADAGAQPKFVAADLLSQAVHYQIIK